MQDLVNAKLVCKQWAGWIRQLWDTPCDRKFLDLRLALNWRRDRCRLETFSVPLPCEYPAWHTTRITLDGDLIVVFNTVTGAVNTYDQRGDGFGGVSSGGLNRKGPKRHLGTLRLTVLEKIYVVACINGYLFVLDRATLKLKQRIEPEAQPDMSDCPFHPTVSGAKDGRVVVAHHSPAVVVVFKLRDGLLALEKVFSREGNVLCLDESPGASHFVTIERPWLGVHSTETGELLYTFKDTARWMRHTADEARLVWPLLVVCNRESKPEAGEDGNDHDWHVGVAKVYNLQKPNNKRGPAVKLIRFPWSSNGTSISISGDSLSFLVLKNFFSEGKWTFESVSFKIGELLDPALHAQVVRGERKLLAFRPYRLFPVELGKERLCYWEEREPQEVEGRRAAVVVKDFWRCSADRKEVAPLKVLC